MARNFYVTREEVYEARDFKGSTVSARAIDSAILAASRSIDILLDRRFYPTTATKYFNAPTGTVLWLDVPDALISATSVTSGGVAISSDDYFLEPVNYGPPYNRLELDLGGNGTFTTAGTTQRQVAITGVWGYNVDTEPVTTLASSPGSSTTYVDVADSSAVGIGSLIVIGTEYLEVTDKQLVDTGQNASAMDAKSSTVTITGVTGVNAGEIIQIDSEQMRVTSVSGTTLTVERAYGGSVLASHALDSDIYVYRRLVASRGVNGSTAAMHGWGNTVSKVVYPADIVELCLAETLNTLSQRKAEYGRTIGSADNLVEARGAALGQLRAAAVKNYRRYKIR